MSALILNLFGGPGSGKSTGAAYVFSMLKMLGVNAELVTEAAKDLTWEESFKNLKDQVYVFGKQAHRINRCADKVDIIVTDSPIFLSTIYNQDETIDRSLYNLVLDTINKYENYNVLLRRVKPYNPIGRNQTAEQSDAITSEIKKYLDNANMQYIEVDGNMDGYSLILANAISLLHERGINI